VFQSVTGEYGEAKGFDIPENFYGFYEDPLFRHFLACIVYYYFGYVDLRKLEARMRAAALDDGDPKPNQSKKSSSSPDNNNTSSSSSFSDINNPSSSSSSSSSSAAAATSIHAREITYTQTELRRRLRLVGEAYSRLLLNCSNFEHTSEDKRFFEFVFEFTRSVTRLAIDKKYWDDMEGSLSYLFRGYMFNNPALRSRSGGHSHHHHGGGGDVPGSTTDPAGGAGGDGGDGGGAGSTSAGGNGGADKEEGGSGLANADAGTDGDGSDPSSANALLGAKRGSNGKPLEPIDLARRTLAKYRSRITGAPRAREIRARRRLRKQRLQEAATNDIFTGLLPPEVAHVSAIHQNAVRNAYGKKRFRSGSGGVRGRGGPSNAGDIGSRRDTSGLETRRSMQSVREIINTRSPLVSLLLPTPMERAAQNHLLERAGRLVHKKKRAEERAERERQKAEWEQAQAMLPPPRQINDRSSSGGGSSNSIKGRNSAKAPPVVRGATGATRTGKVVYNGEKGRSRKKRGAALFEV
jgi:hypothetical protein